LLIKVPAVQFATGAAAPLSIKEATRITVANRRSLKVSIVGEWVGRR
jgi:hypothetical protein